MLPGIIIIGIVGYFAWKKYKKLNFMKRLAVKLVGVYIAGLYCFCQELFCSIV